MSELIINEVVSRVICTAVITAVNAATLLTARTLYTQTDHINRTAIKGCCNGPTQGRGCSPQELLVGVPHGPVRLSTHGCLRLVNYGYPQRARLSLSRVAPGHKNASLPRKKWASSFKVGAGGRADTQLCRQSQQRQFNSPGRHTTPHVAVASSVQQLTGTIIYLIIFFIGAFKRTGFRALFPVTPPRLSEVGWRERNRKAAICCVLLEAVPHVIAAKLHLWGRLHWPSSHLYNRQLCVAETREHDIKDPQMLESLLWNTNKSQTNFILEKADGGDQETQASIFMGFRVIVMGCHKVKQRQQAIKSV